MLMQVDFWQLISIAFTILGAIWGVLKLGLRQFEGRLHERYAEQDKRLADLSALLKAEAEDWKRLDRELMALKAELPIQYVRREDYVRGQSAIEARLDAIYNRIEVVYLKGKSP